MLSNLPNYKPIRMLVLFLLSLLLTEEASSQPDVIWTRTISGNGYINARTVLCDSDNSIWISGVIYGEEFLDLYVLKLNSDGDSLWSHIFEQPGEDGGGFLCQTQNGDFVLAGHGPVGPGNGQVHLIRIQPNGEVVWEQTYGSHNSEDIEAIIETDNGDFLIAGNSGITPLLFRVNSVGDSIWMHFYPSLSIREFKDVVQISNGDFIIIGRLAIGENSQLVVARIDSLGNLIESNDYGGDGREMGHAISGSEDNGFLFSGRSNSFSENVWDIYLVKHNASGDTEWTQTIENGEYLSAEQAIYLNDGSHTILSISGLEGEWGVELTNIDDSGDIQWRSVYPIGNSWFPWTAFGLDTADQYVLAGTNLPDELVVYKVSGGTQGFEHLTRGPLQSIIDLSAYPNPFNSITNITLTIPFRMNVVLSVYDINGRLVRNLNSGIVMPGKYSSNFGHENLATGVYFVQCVTPNTHTTIRIIHMR